jgi:fibro-slime domain-containing protein
VFINDRLAIDLGGVHGSESQEVSLDERAAELEIEPGKVYPLALFFAERHTSGSTFRIDTTIAEFDACPDP